MRKIIIVFIMVSSVLFTLFVPSLTVTAEEKQKISINTLSEEVLFHVDNMKPGDWAPRTVDVQNNGEMEFEYHISIENSGSEKLFNELMLEVSDDNKELYNGKLAEYEKIPARKLAPSSEEELSLTVRFPDHLGNAFQGLDATFNFSFNAKGSEEIEEASSNDELSDDGMVGSNKDGAVLPNTATNTFNFLLIGFILFAISMALITIKQRKTKTLDRQQV
ncbi:LPXTG cell wall anchor domain-containing protein [Virgibacillus byunsanensis]|uniref:LPXTG cell wall anchor domain-containing protein n=1 Tax=Virgibacillus byunsanensis TaxID=570945 RepID=A0ABW3LNK8_9BACI